MAQQLKGKPCIRCMHARAKTASAAKNLVNGRMHAAARDARSAARSIQSKIGGGISRLGR